MGRSRGWLREGWSILRLGLFGLIACLVAMGFSYGLVRHLTRGLSVIERVDPVHLDAARRLRSHTNELVRIANDYAAKAPADTPLPPGFDRWLSQETIPRLRALRRSMTPAESGSAEESAPYRELLRVIDRFTAMANHPEDKALRRQTLGDVRRASEAAEGGIAAMGAAKHLAAPRERCRF